MYVLVAFGGLVVCKFSMFWIYRVKKTKHVLNGWCSTGK